MRGQGIAKQLLEKVIELAKNNNAQIIPTCSYAKAAFAANPDYQKLAIKNPNEEANDESWTDKKWKKISGTTCC